MGRSGNTHLLVSCVGFERVQRPTTMRVRELRQVRRRHTGRIDQHDLTLRSARTLVAARQRPSRRRPGMTRAARPRSTSAECWCLPTSRLVRTMRVLVGGLPARRSSRRRRKREATMRRRSVPPEDSVEISARTWPVTPTGSPRGERRSWRQSSGWTVVADQPEAMHTLRPLRRRIITSSSGSHGRRAAARASSSTGRVARAATADVVANVHQYHRSPLAAAAARSASSGDGVSPTNAARRSQARRAIQRAASRAAAASPSCTARKLIPISATSAYG